MSSERVLLGSVGGSQEEVELIRKAGLGDDRAMFDIAARHEDRLRRLARRFSHGDKDLADELHSRGLEALLRLVTEKLFDAGRGKSLWSYGFAAVRGEMARGLHANKAVSTPDKATRRVRRIRTRLRKQLDAPPTTLQIAEVARLPVAEVERLLNAEQADSIDLDDRFSDSALGWLGEDATDIGEGEDDRRVMHSKAALLKACSAAFASAEMRMLFSLRYGRLLHSSGPLTLEHAAKRIGLTRERALMMEVKALEILEERGLLPRI